MIEVAWSDLHEAEFPRRDAAITIGVFDGIHAGHGELIGRITSSREGLAVVVTFQRHPSEVLGSGHFPGFLMSGAQKRAALRDSGIDVVVSIDFSLEFSKLPGAVFLGRLLDAFRATKVVVGHDFRCGNGLDTGPDELRSFLSEKGVAFEVVPPVVIDGAVVSSTGIRRAVLAGDLEAVRRLLGRAYTLDLTGEEIVRDQDEFYVVKERTGVLPESKQLAPPPGRYRVQLVGTESTCESELIVGENSLRWPLSGCRPIRYIVLTDRRLEHKE